MNGKHKSIRSVQSTPSFNNPSNEIDTSATLPRSVSGTLKPKGYTSNAKTTTNPESDLNTKMHSSTQTQTSVDSVSSLYNSRALQKTSDTLVLYDFPAAVLYKYPLHASLIPKDYDQCPRVSELLIQQSSMFVVARGKFQIYKVRGLDSDTELNLAGTAPLVPLTSPKPSSPNTLHSSDTVSKDSENKGPTDYSKTLSYLRCGHMVHPILPKMRIWKISKNMYILPQPSPKNFWRLEIELQNDELDVPEMVDLGDLDEIWKETCYYQSIYVPPPSLPPATKSGNVKPKYLKTDEPALQNPSHGSRNTEFQRLTKHFEKECEKNEERKEHAFKKRALQESKNAKPQNVDFDQDVMPDMKDQYLDLDAKDELIANLDSDSEIWTNIKDLESGNGLGLELAGCEESKETLGLQTDVNSLDPALEPCFDNENTLKPVKSQLTIPKKPHNLEDIYEENADQSQADNNFNANLVFDDPFGFPLNSPPHKSFPESTLDAPQHFSSTFSSEGSDQFASSPGSNLDFYLQQDHVSPTVSELFGTPTAGQHAQHAPNTGRRVSFSGSPTWSGYSSPVSRNSAISSSSTLDHILDAFEAPETRFGNHCHTVPSQSSAAAPTLQRPGHEASARGDKPNASSQSQPSVIGQLRNLGLSGLANFPNMTTLNFGSLSNNFRNFRKLSYSTTSLASPEVYLDDANEASGTVYTESTVSLDEQLLSNEKGKRFVNDDRGDTAYFCASVGSSAETLTDAKVYKSGTCDKATQTQISSSFVLEDGALVLGSSSACQETVSNSKRFISGPSSSLTLSTSSARPTSSSGLLTIQDLTTNSALRHSRSHTLLGRRAFSSQQQHPLANRIGFIGPITTLIASGQYSFPVQPLRPRRNSVGPTEIGHAGAVKTLRRSTSQTNLSSTFFSSNMFFDQSLPTSQSKTQPAFKRSVSLNALAIEDHDQVAPLGPGSRAAPVVGLLTPEKHAQLFDGTRKDIQEVQMKGARLTAILKKQ